MGMNTSFMGEKGLSTSQVVNLVMNTLYKRFVEKDTKEFDAFHVAILDTFNTVNMALPGKHYDAPSYEDVKDFFKGWKEANEEARKRMFTDFMNKNVNLNKVDESMVITAIVAPPAAMMAKRTGQTVPQLKLMNVIPDVVFVPSTTVLALIAVKILRLMFMGNTTSKGASTGSYESFQQTLQQASQSEEASGSGPRESHASAGTTHVPSLYSAEMVAQLEAMDERARAAEEEACQARQAFQEALRVAEERSQEQAADFQRQLRELASNVSSLTQESRASTGTTHVPSQYSSEMAAQLETVEERARAAEEVARQSRQAFQEALQVAEERSQKQAADFQRQLGELASNVSSLTQESRASASTTHVLSQYSTKMVARLEAVEKRARAVNEEAHQTRQAFQKALRVVGEHSQKRAADFQRQLGELASNVSSLTQESRASVVTTHVLSQYSTKMAARLEAVEKRARAVDEEAHQTRQAFQKALRVVEECSQKRAADLQRQLSELASSIADIRLRGVRGGRG